MCFLKMSWPMFLISLVLLTVCFILVLFPVILLLVFSLVNSIIRTVFLGRFFSIFIAFSLSVKILSCSGLSITVVDLEFLKYHRSE